MYLKKLSLSGFKSFADTTEFVFDPGTTVVVGPNGCGKSNVVDAFRWVLGERSAKGLRGQEMMDVIFKGTRNRPQLSRAEVSLVFDNEDGTLPVDFSEVEVTRRLYRSGESEYLINKRKCRLKDVKRLFTDTGIGTEGYSILEQGSVDAFLHATSTDRRSIFEEAAGISRFKEQKNQSMRQLERTKVNLDRLRDILGEVERRVRSVKIQAGKARRFLEDKDHLVKLRAVLSDSELEILRAQRQELTFRLSITSVRRNLLERVGQELETERETLKRQVEEAGEAVSRLREREMQIRMDLERIDQRHEHLRELQADLEHGRDRREEQRQELFGFEEQSRHRRDEIRRDMREKIARLRELRVAFAEADERRRELAREKTRLDEFIREAKEKVVSHLFAETRLSNDKTALESEARGLEAMGERREAEGAEFEASLAEQSELLGRLDEELGSVRALGIREEEAVHLVRAELDRRHQLLSDTQKTLSGMREQFEVDQARLRFLEGLEESHEGIGPGAQRMLESQHPMAREILGLLADHIEADPGVAGMVDAVLGRFSETVVLRDDAPLEDRARIVEEILDGEGVTFCHSSRAEGSRDVPAAFGDERLVDLIRCAPQHRSMLTQVMGNVFVVESLHTALKQSPLHPDRRYVTREGVLVEPWGAVSIPSRHGAGGLVSRHAEITLLQRDLAERETELGRVSADAAALEMGISSRQEELRRHEEAHQRAALEAESLERRSGACEHEVERLSERVNLVRAEIEEIRESRTRVAGQLTEAAARFAESQEERAGLEREATEREARLPAISDRLEEEEESVSAIRLESTQEEERIISLRREELGVHGEIQERVERRAWLDREDVRDQEKEASYQEEREGLAEKRTAGEAQLESLATDTTAARSELDERRRELEERESKTHAVRRLEEVLRTRREDDLLQENECRMHINSTRERFEEEFERGLDAVPLAEWRAELTKEEEELEDEAWLERWREELAKVQDRLRKNASVNLEAVQELEELEEREQFLGSQIEDLESSRTRLEETIEELNKKSREMFSTTFEVVRAHFKELFSKIFNGGQADLVLEEGVDVLEAGVEVKARPPGKRISSLRLLSGGEKALTAISVLFALFRFRPSPFCLLDEVDAPLDEANIRRFVRILEEFTADTQFLIISHSKVTMAEGETLYGVTMEEEGVSKKVSVRLDDVEGLEKSAQRPQKTDNSLFSNRPIPETPPALLNRMTPAPPVTKE